MTNQASAKTLIGNYFHRGGTLNLADLSLNGINLPDFCNSDLDLSRCNLNNVELPKQVGGTLVLFDSLFDKIALPKELNVLFIDAEDIEGLDNFTSVFYDYPFLEINKPSELNRKLGITRKGKKVEIDLPWLSRIKIRWDRR
jgi:hypothetical protein